MLLAKKITLFLLFMLIMQLSSFTQTSFRFNSSDLKQSLLQHGDYNYLHEKYAEALTDYHQYIYKFPNDGDVPAVYYRIALTFLKLENRESAKNYLEKIRQEFPRSPLYNDSRLREILIDYDRGDYLEVLKQSVPQTFLPYRIISAYALIRLNWLEEADSVLNLCLKDTIRLSSDALMKIKEGISNLPELSWKIVWGARTASLILPGSGRFFLHQYYDASLTLTNFLFLTALAVDGKFLVGKNREKADIPQTKNLATGFAKNALTPDYNNSRPLYPPSYKIYHSGYLDPLALLTTYYILNIFATNNALSRYEDNMQKEYLDNLLRQYPLPQLLALYDPFREENY